MDSVTRTSTSFEMFPPLSIDQWRLAIEEAPGRALLASQGNCVSLKAWHLVAAKLAGPRTLGMVKTQELEWNSLLPLVEPCERLNN